MRTLTLDPDELQALTGYAQRARQLDELHRQGFVRARIVRGVLVLERAHYEAVCSGMRAEKRPQLRMPRAA